MRRDPRCRTLPSRAFGPATAHRRARPVLWAASRTPASLVVGWCCGHTPSVPRRTARTRASATPRFGSPVCRCRPGVSAARLRSKAAVAKWRPHRARARDASSTAGARPRRRTRSCGATPSGSVACDLSRARLRECWLPAIAATTPSRWSTATSAVSMWTYLGEGHFWEGLFENWESEFLQMAAYIVLTAFLIQRGSSESKDPDKDESVDADPRDADRRRGCSMAGSAGRHLARALRELARDRVRGVVHRLDRRTRVRWVSPSTTPTCDNTAKPR